MGSFGSDRGWNEVEAAGEDLGLERQERVGAGAGVGVLGV